MAAGEGLTDGSEERLDVAPDEALARRVQQGDSEALEQLVRRYLRPIHAVAASYLSESADVEDAAQETFLRAVRGIEAYDPDRPFAPWLYQIARNVARNRLAAGARSYAEPLSEALQSALPSPHVLLERSEIRRRVGAAITRLPERQRTAFHLSDVEGYATGEVARIMGLSAGTVRSHVHYARKALRAALAESPEAG
ncbi:MAG: sigma-70 family RNA polymerase sigma factor [Gemmatimonadetes bacterium]|nr:sigma-70 family RNA polymerase sigma factor [Gemmatimonadota bacterium]